MKTQKKQTMMQHRNEYLKFKKLTNQKNQLTLNN
jgi:hypothetical protein